MSAPVITYPPELPVSAARDEIAAAIRDHQVVIVAGATGSGKTTQLPKIALELGRTSIAHTQPRRLAARTIAERVAEELQVELGDVVGYKVRFTDQVSDRTQIALMTDGILLNEIHRDRLLRRYDTIIIDEAHERSLNIDFLMGYLVRILPERPDLKVIITSATIDPESFARHFSLGGEPAPIVEVSGRTYPVEIRYREPADTDADDTDDVDAIVSALKELDREAPGDVLVFLPGEAEIRDAADAVRAAFRSTTAPVEVLPLFGRLSAADQHRVFEPSKIAGLRRRVVLATNVAETSLTVPGIKYVVDTGTARISRYSTRSKVQRLPIEAVSQASAQQRSGRAGRTSDGIAIRLYGEDDFSSRPEYTDPEILRTNLASVVLQMLSLGFGDIAAFPFLTPPDSRNIKAALDLLTELGAVREGRDGPELTRIGRDLSRLPIEPRFARMLLEGARTGVLPDLLAIVAGMSIQDVRERPEDKREQADAAHARFIDPTSDFLTLLNLWKHLNVERDERGSSAFRRMCRDEFLNYVRVREWFDVHRQLQSLTRDIARRPTGDGTRGRDSERRRRPASDARAHDRRRDDTRTPKRDDERSAAADPDAVHRAILSGLLSQIGILDERTAGAGSNQKGQPGKPKGRVIAQYRGARGITFSIFPGSGLKKRSPQAVMAAELVETSRLFARTVAAIDPAWAESLAGDLVTRSVNEPHWSKASGAAMAYEKVTLFGVEIIPRRRVQFARIDRAAAREMFVRHALVEGEWDPSSLPQNVTAFLRQNHELRRRLEKQEERERRRDILVGDEAVFGFYDARIPAEVFDVRSFEKWWREQLTRTPKLLTMREDDLVDRDGAADRGAFPSQWPQGDQTLGLAYRFEPGARDDGVTAVIPLPLLAGLRPDGFDWQVPGARDELITAMLRALPKAIRRNVVPAADWAERFAAEIADDGPENTSGLPTESLAEALARRIQRVANQPVTAAAFELERVPAHLTMNFRAVDGRGRAIDSDRDLATLQARLADRARDSVASSLQRSKADAVAAAPVRTIERTGITDWDLDELPVQVDTKVAGGVVRGYPALADDGESVSIRMLTDPVEAERVTRRGVRRLVLLHVPSPVSYVQEHLTSKEKLSLAASPYSGVRQLIEDCRVAVADDVIARTVPGVVRTRADFEKARDAVSAAVVDETFQTVSLVARILDLHREATKGLKSATAMTLLAALTDMRAQLDGLVFPGFVSATGRARLAHLPRYLDGVRIRTAGLIDNAGRDRVWMTEYERARALYDEAGGTIPLAAEATPSIVHVRWLLEEFRVSLFAQRLGTAEPVSMQRITKALRGG